MKRHVKIYLDWFGLHGETAQCEICEAEAVDVHHIIRRGMGGGQDADRIENLMGLCRDCHTAFGDRHQYIELLKRVHFLRMQNHAHQNRVQHQAGTE